MQISIVRFSDIPSFDRRIDPEFFEPKYLKIENLLKTKNSITLGNLCNLYDGPFGSDLLSSSYSENGVPALRMQNITKDGFPNLDNVEFIAEQEANRLIKHIAYAGEVITTKIGFLGYSTVLPSSYKRYFFRRELTRLVIKDTSQINPYYLATFLNSSYGRIQASRYSSGTTRDRILLVNQHHMLIPIFSYLFQQFIENIIIKANDLRENSTVLYQQAQDILLEELGLNNWKPAHRLYFVKRYSDTQQAGRIDAEYFQPKYDDIIDAIKAYKGGYSTIRAEFKQNKATFEVDSEKLYQYVEIGSINVSNGEISPSEVLGSELPANAKRALNKNDVIVSKVRTYRGAITIVEKDGYVGSGAFTTLAEDGSVNKETLLAFLHSKPLLAWSLKPNTGTSYPVIVDEDILSLPIPVLSQPKQQEIQQKIAESFALRKKSKQLLEAAKCAVEIAIEQGETAAMQWLESQ